MSAFYNGCGAVFGAEHRSRSGGLAGGGSKGGVSYGTSDELGIKAAEHQTYCYDMHATILHLLGIDHEKLSFRHSGIDRRLTDVHGHVIKDIIS